MKKLILAIETSCDETAAAIVENGTKVLSSIIFSQIKIHQPFGGVIPEIASRNHVSKITLCINTALQKATVSSKDLDAVAVTQGPGLIGCLLVGISAAKSFAWANNLPLISVNHLAGHIYSAQLVETLEFPLISLLVSGGHTQLVYMKKNNDFKIIGQTRDDAVGECYDKVGRILGLSYPSGKKIEKLARRGKDSYHFPRPMIHEKNFDFSFSGLKSSFSYLIHKSKKKEEILKIEDLATSFQDSVIDVLLTKSIKACQLYPVKQLILSGGVSANKKLREAFKIATKKELPHTKLVLPSLEFCTDNAAMIGAAAYIKLKNKEFSDMKLNGNPNLSLEKKNNSHTKRNETALYGKEKIYLV